MTAIGFTGTRHGMTLQQHEVVEGLLRSTDDLTEAHHGDCVGADAEFHAVAQDQGLYIVIHPPIDQRFCARCYPVNGIRLKNQDYKTRNHAIVKQSHWMIATPGQNTEQWRGSGTWATIRYTIAAKKRIVIVYPDGSIDERNPHHGL